jgi:hypothetical protein
MMLRLAFGATDVQVNTTSTLSRLLEATHRRHCVPARATKSRYAMRSVSVHLAPPERSPEFALRDAEREIASEVAAAHGWLAVKAVVVERGGRALALSGAPGSGKSTVAAHLVARGWKLVTDDVAFIDAETGTIVGHHGLMRFRSGAIPHLPAAFKVTLERSRWFVGEDGELEFYEVDPASVFGAEVWSAEAVLDSVVIIDARATAHAVQGVSYRDGLLVQLDGTVPPSSVLAAVRAGAIGRDRSVYITDRIERWYEAHVPA